MKNWIFLFLLLFAVRSFAGRDEIVISVKGMVCAFCAQGITKKFKAEPSVTKVEVSLEKKLVILTQVPGQTLSDTRIEAILQDSGYTVEKIERR